MLVIIVVVKHQSCSKMNIARCIFESKNKFSANGAILGSL